METIVRTTNRPPGGSRPPVPVYLCQGVWHALPQPGQPWQWHAEYYHHVSASEPGQLLRIEATVDRAPVDGQHAWRVAFVWCAEAGAEETDPEWVNSGWAASEVGAKRAATRRAGHMAAAFNEMIGAALPEVAL